MLEKEQEKWILIQSNLKDQPTSGTLKIIFTQVNFTENMSLKKQNSIGMQVSGVLDVSEMDSIIATIDAAISHLFGLSVDDVEHLFATFHRGWSYEGRLSLTLEKYLEIAGAK